MQDSLLNSYLSEVGQRLAANSHRPDMPYSSRAVNANYVNAYAFPGGIIATTRSILLELENKAELAALLGHEIGHVNARHQAEEMTGGIVSQFGNFTAGALSQHGATRGLGSTCLSAYQRLMSCGYIH